MPMDLPFAGHPYRVPRSRIEESFDRGEPLPFQQVGAAEVTDVATDGETATVDFGFGDDPVGGVVVLGEGVEPGDWVEIHQRDDLLVIPETPSGADWTPVQPIGFTCESASGGINCSWTGEIEGGGTIPIPGFRNLEIRAVAS